MNPNPRFGPRPSWILLALAGSCVLAGGVPARARVVLNEVLAVNRTTNADEEGEPADWLEIHNAGDEPVDLGGWSVTDDRDVLSKWTFPGLVLPPGAYLLVWCSGKDRASVPVEAGAGEDPGFPFAADLVGLDHAWRYLARPPAEDGPPAGWASAGFDDGSWKEGVPGIGFGSVEGIRTKLPDGLGAVFLRRAFDLPAGRRHLVLRLRYDDGFVAYLDGERAASDHFPEGEEPRFSSRASRSHSARRAERFDVTPSLEGLEPGRHVLAIALLNSEPESRDLAVFPELGTVTPVLHTSFRLAREGETVLLVDGTGRLADAVTFPAQTPDQSWGRSPDGEGPFRYHLRPTPGAPNEGPAADEPLLVDELVFRPQRGFYDEPVAVEIATETEGAEIRYTLDGSEPTQDGGRPYEGLVRIEGTATLRARAFAPGLKATPGVTHTYIFLDDVLGQSRRSALERGFPSDWGGNAADYAMDPRVIGPNDRFGGKYAATIRDDLRSLPSMSIVMDREDLFGSGGIYANPRGRGDAWERSASVELISPDGAAEFQVNCGIRIQGGYFRRPSAARKHSLRLLFQAEHGPTKLRFPLFGEGAARSFDTITLRAGANDGYSWSAARLTEQYIRDEFGRELQRATGHPSAHGTFVHLYLNGLYWGLYNPVERPDHSFSASYHGGEKEDWDALHDGEATEGDTRAWAEMVRKAAAARSTLAGFQELRGRNPDGTPNPDLPAYLDVENYIDYLIVNLWGGNWDWPWKNWWAARRRTPESTGFQFYCWDYENTIGNNRSRSPLTKNALQNDFSSAGVPHQRLRSNPEYRLLFGDRVRRLFSGDGPLRPEALIARYRALADRVERAIVAESARWGDQHHEPPLTLREWRAERDWALGTYLPRRSEIVLDQFRRAGLYPRVEAPRFNHPGGVVPSGFRWMPRAGEGVVWYTTGGEDPRLPGGELSPAAIEAVPGEERVLVAPGAGVRIHVPADDGLGLEWTRPGFDDTGWIEGRAAVGYDTGSAFEESIETDVEDLLHGVNASLYLRIAFDVEDPPALAFVALQMLYDDGYVAYLNGERVASRFAPDDLAWDAQADGGRSDRLAVEPEEAAVDAPFERLRAGRNVLAIHALNRRPDDTDFLIGPQLVAVDASEAGRVIERSTRIRARVRAGDEWSALTEATYAVDTGVPLRVTELLYQPAPPPEGSRFGPDELEWIELLNTGKSPLDLAEIRLRGGVEFALRASPFRELPPGERLVLAADPEAFAARYETTGLRVAGPYAGRLDDAGDTLVLEGRLGEPVLAFRYESAWHPETAGGGSSLEIVDAGLPREAWGEAASWRASERPGGTPGQPPEPPGSGGWQLPGDGSQDGRLDISDAVVLLRLLFVDGSREPACPGGLDDAGNRTLHDVNDDGAVDLSDAVGVLDYLFRGGPAPAAGVDCVRIRGCADVCAR